MWRRRIQNIEKTHKKDKGYYFKAKRGLLESIVYCIEKSISQGKQEEKVSTYIKQLRKNNYAQEYMKLQLDEHTTIHLEKNLLCIPTNNKKEEHQKKLDDTVRHAEYCLAKEGYKIISSQD